jgi:hypothetical protein
MIWVLKCRSGNTPKIRREGKGFYPRSILREEII